MNTAIPQIDLPSAAPSDAAWTWRHRLHCHWLEARCECLRLLRTPAFAIPSLLFPALFYLLFGVLLNHDSGDAARYLMATYGVFGVMGAGLFGFGVTVALERERGFLTYKRALPMPPGAYLLAKLAMALMFAAAIAALISAIGASLGGVELTWAQWLLLYVVHVLGVLPFCALGLWIGTLVGGQGAPVLVNLLYLPMALLSGLWLPLSMLPSWLAKLAPVWPSYHHAQLALKVVGMDAGGSIPLHLAVLLGSGAVFFVLALRRLRG